MIFIGISELLTMSGEGTPEERLGIVRDAALIVDDGRVTWLGARSDVGAELARPTGASTDHVEFTDLGGVVVLPGLVDCHTHLVYAGDRAADFEARCRGETYQSIAQRGGGIRTTVAATRAASAGELLGLARARRDALLAHGVTTIEVKSGYGLTVESELRQLAVVNALDAEGPARIVPTLLLHIVPDEYRDARAEWVRIACDELIPRAARESLAAAVDVFCDVGAFSADEARAILVAGRAAGLAVKAHVEQLSATGFGETAAALGALSLEHLEHASPAVIAAMAANGTVAVLLPAASIFLGDAHKPPVAAFREAGIAMAIATDHNPGSSPTFDPWLAATLACTWYGLSPAEALLGLTTNAARALGLGDGRGTLVPGVPADFAIARLPRWQDLVYGLGHRPIAGTFVAGIAVPADRGGYRPGAGD